MVEVGGNQVAGKVRLRAGTPNGTLDKTAPVSESAPCQSRASYLRRAATGAFGCRARRSRWGGGMRTVSPDQLSGRYLSFAEREEIAILRGQQLGVREMARRLGRSPSTISRELCRNASTRSCGAPHRATTAQWHAERRAGRPKLSKLAANDTLRATSGYDKQPDHGLGGWGD
jgi:hypothetical protein